MRIALVTPGGFDPEPNGMTIPALLDLATSLSKQVRVTVFPLRQFGEPARFDIGNAHVIRSRNALSSMQSCVWGVRAIAAEHHRAPFSALHAFWLHSPGLVACLAGRLLRVPVVASLGGGELVSIPEVGYGSQRSARNRFAILATLRLADQLTAASRYALTPLAERRLDATQISLGADPERFPPSEVPFELRSGIVAVGDINRVKDYPVLLSVFAQLRRVFAEELNVYGVDTLNGAMMREAERLGIAGMVRFHGRAAQKTVARALRSAKLLLHASRHEAGPLAFMEAALSGAPVVSTHVGHMADLSGTAALTAAVGDAKCLGEEAASALDDLALSARIAEAASRFANERDVSATARRFLETYCRCLP